MSDGWGMVGVAFVVLMVVFGITSCSSSMEACRRAGGIPQYEYKNMPSCWSQDGRRIFPH